MKNRKQERFQVTSWLKGLTDMRFETTKLQSMKPLCAFIILRPSRVIASSWWPKPFERSSSHLLELCTGLPSISLSLLLKEMAPVFLFSEIGCPHEDCDWENQAVLPAIYVSQQKLFFIKMMDLPSIKSYNYAPSNRSKLCPHLVE